MSLFCGRELRAASAGFALIAATAGATAATFTDGFDGNAIDPAWWTAATAGGSTVAAVDQRLELTQGEGGFAGLTFNLPIKGDFTARIDYALLAWPADNKERLALGAVTGANQLLIERVSDSLVGLGTEVYVTDFTGQGILGTPTADLTGTLRLERVGDTVQGAFWTGTAWNVIGTYSVAGEGSLARTIGFSIFPGVPVTPGVKVALDNFTLTGPNVPIPEPGTAALLVGGLGLLLISGKRRSGGR
jgi:hypothetical protein